MIPKPTHPWKAPVKQRPRGEWTAEQLEAERKYRITERLGILCGAGPETLSANFIAGQEADSACEILRKEQE